MKVKVRHTGSTFDSTLGSSLFSPATTLWVENANMVGYIQCDLTRYRMDPSLTLLRVSQQYRSLSVLRCGDQWQRCLAGLIAAFRGRISSLWLLATTRLGSRLCGETSSMDTVILCTQTV